MNNQHPILRDAEVRTALAYSMDVGPGDFYLDEWPGPAYRGAVYAGKPQLQ